MLFNNIYISQNCLGNIVGKKGGSAIHCGEGWVDNYNLYVVEFKYWIMDIDNSCIKIQLQI